MSDPRLFDINAAVKYFHEVGATAATRNFVRELIANGGLPKEKIGRKFYVSKKSLDEWIERNERRSR